MSRDPAVPTEERKLAAIMFTDMVGYSALSQRDDKLALELLEEHRRLLREIFPRFHGTEVKTIGDAFLVEFGSALEAAQCAIEIQRALAKRNTDVPADQHISVKIGIHIGDVVHRDGDVYGDGVNIAARIEPLAGAGGICVSMDVERQIRNALEARFEKFRSADLKNIKLPMDLFRIVLPWESGVKIAQTQAQRSKKLPLIAGIAAILLLGLFLGWRFLRHSSPGHHEASGAAENAVAMGAPNPPDQKSVAVLAFVNLSDEKNAEYFSDGISEELLTILQKIPGLHVAARTSAFSFKGKNATAQEIGQKLGVAHLVEGSVRKSGNTVRIAARLSRTDTGQELWSENFTRELKDVFAVETEVARTIVGRLRGQLAGASADPVIQAQVQAAEKGGTKNVAAHEAYLQGRFHENRQSEKSMYQALAAYAHAAKLDPGFALAWAGIARMNLWLASYGTEGGQQGFETQLTAAQNAISQALTIEPDLTEALVARVWIEISFDFNSKAAGRTVDKLLALAPGDPSVLIAAANLEGLRGNVDRALELHRKAVGLDPVNTQARRYLAAILVTTKHFAEARNEFERVKELNPAAPWAHAGLGLVDLLQGQFEEAAREAQADAADFAKLVIVSCARWAQERVAESDAALNELIKNNAETAAYQIAEAYAYRGDKDNAFQWLERARRQRDSGLTNLRSDHLLENLHADPRWNAFLRTMGLADDQLK